VLDVPGPEGAARDGAPRTARVLPAEAVASLRDAFRGEVEDRLPRLLALLDGQPGEGALRDAHALGSSAVVVGEAEASRTARALEAELARDRPDQERCAELVRELADRLSAWAFNVSGSPA
jgi:HPt (histidine-containing phosphotransfer) domain-containing protein